jgi:hypothetical protein
MAQTGFTPILTYASGTASNVPLAANLTSSASGAELALNYADGKLYFKNSSGVVTLLASAAGASGDVVGPASATDNALARFDLTTGKLIQNSVGILSDAGILTGLTGLTSSGNVTFSALTSTRVPYASTGGLLVDSANMTFNGTRLTVADLADSGLTAGRVVYVGSGSALVDSAALTFDGTLLATTGNISLGAGSNLTWGGAYGAGIPTIAGSSGALLFYPNGSTSGESMRLNSSGNLGLGVTPSATSVTGYRALEIGAVGSGFLGGANDLNATVNAYYNTGLGGWIRANTSAPARYQLASGAHVFYTAAAGTTGTSFSFTQAMTLDASGNLGLGVTPSAWGGSYGAIETTGAGLWSINSGNLDFIQNGFYNGTNYRYRNTNLASRYNQNAGVHSWFTAASGTAGNAISFTQAMTLDASGNLGIGTTSPGFRLDVNGVGNFQGVRVGANGDTINGSLGLLAFQTSGTERARITSGGAFLVGTTNTNETQTNGFIVLGSTLGYVATSMSASTNSTSTYHVFSTGANAYRFYVGLGGTVYATSTTISAISDQRLKENVQDLDAGLDKIMALKPRKFDWKAGKGKDIKGDRGWIAQEFEQVFPDLIDEWKDPAPEGEEPYKSVRADLIPVLVKAIQEQQALITSLTARIAALEAK